ncbi:hypothetical protein AA100600_0472 [Gluconobacter thailandicus F149-1 = NBRC 100600]|nr:hypothetical protein AA100600_0472 [Gluconobacter thailandicus F149-1 = NBRC 100600]
MFPPLKLTGMAVRDMEVRDMAAQDVDITVRDQAGITVGIVGILALL